MITEYIHGAELADAVELYIIDFADAVLAPKIYEHALMAFSFEFDPALIRGYFADYTAGGFGRVSSACPFDTGTRGISLTLMREFVKVRKYASKKDGLRKGDEEAFGRRVYLNLYFNASRKAAEEIQFDEDLIELRGIIESGVKVDRQVP